MASRTEGVVETELVETVLNRREFLETLLDNPTDKRTLVDVTGSSRSTVTRALRDLQSFDLVERTDGDYRVTVIGQLLADEVSTLLDTSSFAWESRDVLAKLPTATFDFGLSELADATITEPTQANPTAPMQRVVELKGDASHVRSLASGRSPGALDAHLEALEHDGQTFESICSRELITWLAAEADRREKLESIVEHDAATVKVYDDDLPLPLGITDDCVFFGLESAEGAPVALVESSNARVREWALDLYEGCAQEAVELGPGDVSDYTS